MKKIFIPFLILTLLAGTSLMAQMDHKISTGMIAKDQGSLHKALDAFNQGLADLSKLKSKNVPKGFYERAQTWLAVARKGDADSAFKAKYPLAVMNAYDDVNNAEAHDDGKWTKKIALSKSLMGGQLLNEGLKQLDKSYGEGLPKEDKDKLLNGSIKYFNAFADLQPDNFAGYNYMGQAKLELQDTTGAIGAFKNAAEKFEKTNTPPRPELEIGYVYYMIGTLEHFKNGNKDAALGAYDAGKTALKAEKARIEEKKADFNQVYLDAAEKRYATLKDILDKSELNILRTSPDKLEEALAKFDKSIAEEPDNYFLHVAYAELLQNVDMDKAAAMYGKAIEIKPGEFHAYLNLGALYVNQAIAIYKEANEMDDYDKGEAHAKKGDELFEKAFPLLESAHKIMPDDLETVKALLQITIRLEKMDDFQKYDKIKKELIGG